MASSPRSSLADVRDSNAAGESFKVDLVTAVAAARGEDPETMGIQLSDYVDLDALEALYSHAQRSDNTAWSVEFAVDDLVVIVQSDGDVTVD